MSLRWLICVKFIVSPSNNLHNLTGWLLCCFLAECCVPWFFFPELLLRPPSHRDTYLLFIVIVIPFHFIVCMTVKLRARTHLLISKLGPAPTHRQLIVVYHTINSDCGQKEEYQWNKKRRGIVQTLDVVGLQSRTSSRQRCPDAIAAETRWQLTHPQLIVV